MLDIKKFIDGLHDYIGKAFAPVIQRLVALEERVLSHDERQVTLTDVKLIVEEAIDELPPPHDGKDGISVTLEEVLAALPTPRDGVDGKSVVPEDLRPMLDGLVAEIPIPKDGKSVTLEDVMPEIIRHLEAMPKPRDGTSVTVEDVHGLIVETVKEAVDAIPKPRDGADGKSVTIEDVLAEIAPVVEARLASIEPPKDGTSVTVEDIQPVIIAEVTRQVGLIPVPRDGVDGKSVTVDQVADLINGIIKQHQAEWELGFERRAMDFLQKVADRAPVPKDGKDGKDGVDGMGLEDYDEEYDGERTLVRRFKVGDRVKEFRHKLRLIQERGIFTSGKNYEWGDCVTFGGSYWMCVAEATDKKPGDNNKDWRLMVRKGRDGKDGEKGPKGDPGKPAPSTMGAFPETGMR